MNHQPTIAARLAEALGLDPHQISGNEGLRITASNSRVVVEVVYTDRVLVDGEPELARVLKQYKLVPLDVEDTP